MKSKRIQDAGFHCKNKIASTYAFKFMHEFVNTCYLFVESEVNRDSRAYSLTSEISIHDWNMFFLNVRYNFIQLKFQKLLQKCQDHKKNYEKLE